MVQVKVVNPEEVKKRISVNTLIPRNSSLLQEGIVITNSLVQPDQEECLKIIMENHSLNSVYLKQEQIVGALESVIQIPVEEISRVQDLQLGAGGKEESIQLYSEQPRAGGLMEEIPISWEQLRSSGGAELQLLIKAYADVFALASVRTKVVEHSIDTQSHPPIR